VKMMHSETFVAPESNFPSSSSVDQQQYTEVVSTGLVADDIEREAEASSFTASSSTPMQQPSASNDQLMSVKLPTSSRLSNKRKHIKTNFNEPNLSSLAQEAQRRERERLQRLEKLREESNVVNGIPKAAVDSCEVVVGSSSNVSIVEDDRKHQSDNHAAHRKETKRKTTVDESEVILLSSGDDSDSTVKPVANWPVRHSACILTPGTVEEDETERLHREERERIRRRRHSRELESTELLEGLLLVNAGKPPDDPDVYVPKHLTHVLQPHQLGGIRFMYDNIIETVNGFDKSSGFGCILAHSMGLGKTIQVIAFTDIFVRATKARNILIIVPVNTILNWYSEYDRWLPDRLADDGTPVRPFTVFLLGDHIRTAEQRAQLLQRWHTEGGVLLIGYDMFRLLVNIPSQQKKRTKKSKKVKNEVVDLEQEEIEIINRKAAHKALINPGPDLVICDEGHRIKNDKTGIATSLNAIRTRRRIVLTGYPLQNNLVEYFCMVDFVRPNFLGTKKEFKNMFERPIKNGICIDSTPSDVKLARQRTHVLVEMLKGFVQRRTHHLLKTILPPTFEYVILLRKSPIQRILYRAFLQYVQSEITSLGISMFNPLKAFAACSKIWNHPDILYDVLEKQKEGAEREKSIVRGSKAEDITAWTERPAFATNIGWCQEGTQQLPATLQTQQSSTSGNNLESAFRGMLNASRCSFPSAGINSSFGDGFIPENAQKSVADRRPVYHNPALPFSSSLAFNGIISPPRHVGSSAFTDGGSSDISLGNTQRNKINTLSANRTIARALLEEMGFDKGVKYDWASLAMCGYKTGVIENGYKMAISLDIIKQATEIGDKVLLFSQSLLTLNLFERYLEKFDAVCTPNAKITWKKNQTYLRFDGSTSAIDREKLINRFNDDPQVYLFLISTRAGSLGINLVAANRVIIFDASWNPCHDAQAVCRIYRYGQKKRTFIYRLVMDNSMERGIFNRQIGKSGLQQRVVDDRQLDVDVTKSELEQLLVYDEAFDVFTGKNDIASWHIDDNVLWLTALTHAHMFSQEPFLHDSLLMEREEGLSAEEKAEAQLLYEREKSLYKGVDFDYGVERNAVERDAYHHRSSFDRMWHYNPSFTQGPLPLRSTPLPMGVERVLDNKWPPIPDRTMLMRNFNQLTPHSYQPQSASGQASNSSLNHSRAILLHRATCPPTAPGEVIDLCDSD
uniref:Helicase ARIP4 n=1 Tax=Parascaris univalens TaxID=6257 RepID=A0A914ZH15_PARUN